VCVPEVTGRSNTRYARALFDFACAFIRALCNADDIVFFDCIPTVTAVCVSNGTGALWENDV
jgi:hypothetical protein